MKIGIIAGNRLLPLILAQRIKQLNKDAFIIAVCFKNETSKSIAKYVDKCHWLKVGQLSSLKKIIKQEGMDEWIMAGQINPMNIFKRKCWDEELTSLIDGICDFRPHTIFEEIIKCLENTGIKFLDSTLYLKEDLAEADVMNNVELDKDLRNDIDFGVKIISKFVELDIGQTMGVKSGAVVGLESLEGTDNTIRRIYRLAGKGCTILKFCKTNQDLRFDVPVVGMSTLKLLKRIKAAGLILESNKVIILQKKKFLESAQKWNIAIVGISAQ